jgi:hypothetical protein
MVATCNANRSNRKAELAVLLDGAGPGLVLNKVFTEPGDIVLKHACALGCEGVVSKRLGSRYERAAATPGSRLRTRARRPCSVSARKIGGDDGAAA